MNQNRIPVGIRLTPSARKIINAASSIIDMSSSEFIESVCTIAGEKILDTYIDQRTEALKVAQQKGKDMLDEYNSKNK